MKLALWGSEASSFFQHIKQRGLLHAIKAAIWRIRTAISKSLLRFQDWLGLYNYSDWIRENETCRVTNRPVNPDLCISIIITTSASSQQFLKATCDSLIQQTYQNWEAHILLDTDIALDNFPPKYENESRVHWLQSPSLSLWKNAIEQCKGAWVECLNCGDILAQDTLAIIAESVSEHPTASVIYSDADVLSVDGLKRHSPSFWPDWSPELLLSINYIRRAFILRNELLDAFVNSNDFDEALLCSTETARQIVHIPQVLCHIREGQVHPWVGEHFHFKSLIAHLERSGLHDLTAQASSRNSSPQFIWFFGQPLVSIIILTHDHVRLLNRCLDSLLSMTDYKKIEIILVENNSQEQATFAYYEQLRSIPQVKLLKHNQPFNFSAFNNWGVQHTSGDLLLFLNNDIECIDSSWLDEMARWASRPEVGVVGAKLLYPHGAIQHAGLVVGLEGHANHVFAGCKEGYSGLFGSVEWYRDYFAVTGACMMMRRNVFDQIGGFDEKYSLAFNDIDICLRAIQAGYRVVYTPFARLVHHEGATRSNYKPSPDIKLAYQQLKTLIEQGDPFYNPNLSLMLRVPTLHRESEISPLDRLDQIVEYSS